MHAFPSLASLALLASTVHASVYVTQPTQSSSCTGGQSCEVAWVDNGETPLLSQIGVCEVGLYTGEYVLAQSLSSVDVSATSSFSFTVDPNAGPNGQYYLVFSVDGISYDGFSGSFTLTGMSGTTPGGGSTTSGTDTNTASAPTTTATGTDTTAASGTPSTTPLSTTTGTATTHSTTTTTTTSKTSTSPSATTTGAAGRVGSSTSLSAVAALLALSGILAF